MLCRCFSSFVLLERFCVETRRLQLLCGRLQPCAQVRLHERPANSALQEMASGWSAPWGGAGGDQWSSWGAPYGGKQKGFGGKPKGGKGKKGKQQESAPAWAPRPEAGAEVFGEWPEPQPTPSGTGRILSRYQFPKALLKDGSGCGRLRLLQRQLPQEAGRLHLPQHEGAEEAAQLS